MDKPFLYLAAPLFSIAERSFNEELANRMSGLFTVYLPQRDGGLYVDLVRKQGISVEEAAQQVFGLDIKALDSADVVLAVLDGRTIDEGVAFEIGYAHALEKPCYGIQTDPRRLLPEGNNPMLMAALKKVAHGLDDLAILMAQIVLTRNSATKKSTSQTT